ncbi:MAG: hypothetical protein Kow006_18580 [Gammaproteobacteria bacterium]
MAQRIGVEPAYLSKIERGEVAPPSEAKIHALADELGEDPDVLLAMDGKVSSDLLEIIRKRPRLFADLIRELKSLPDHAIPRPQGTTPTPDFPGSTTTRTKGRSPAAKRCAS